MGRPEMDSGDGPYDDDLVQTRGKIREGLLSVYISKSRRGY
ncbi:unnamed protein product [Linum tenue]|uniref:Translational initiation factor 1 n=1 Tax=Linum tenue TaxID=586396 RepID=A0AAV0ITU0_9ROSI|nr:unnamed protein product [Linum tenue]CAI0456660.1 unnamed protein product [Linum tenue]